jgi:UrcA family protein
MMKVAVATLAAMLAAAPAMAGTGNPFSADSVVLDLRGIDLTSVDGQQRLAIRVDQAATAVCGDGLSTVHLALGAQARACHADVVADVRSRVARATAMARHDGATQLAMR